MEYINSSGLSIYLRANAGLIYQRINRHPDKRPMLKGRSDEDLRAFIKQTLEEREPCYRMAQRVFDVPGVTAQTLVKSGIFKDSEHPG
jgi:shikimate kinase